MILHSIVRVLVASLMVLMAGVVSGQAPSTSSGQAYPVKPIRIVTSAIGGGGDIAAREIAQGVSGPLGQQMIVENRPGALPGEIVSKAVPDGYTLLVHGGAFWNAPLFRKTSYDPVKDFSPITWVSTSPNVLVVHPSLPVKSVKEAIIVRLNQEIVRILRMPAVKERFLERGVEIIAGSPEELATTVNSEIARLGALIRDTGIKVE